MENTPNHSFVCCTVKEHRNMTLNISHSFTINIAHPLTFE